MSVSFVPDEQGRGRTSGPRSVSEHAWCGDFACGQRSCVALPQLSDFAGGLRRLGVVAVTGDFAVGMRGEPGPAIVGSFATGQARGGTAVRSRRLTVDQRSRPSFSSPSGD
jgi:hypothetical protein